MSTYRIEEEGVMVDTERAMVSWEEATRWNGNNHISKATGTQWNHETLHQSAKGRYWIESTSQWQGSTPSAEFVDPQEAALWLLTNEHELPEDLAELESEVCE